jgi:hypothetical protein
MPMAERSSPGPSEEGKMKKKSKKKKPLVLDFEGIEVTTEIPAADFAVVDIKHIVQKIRQGTGQGRGGQPVGKKSIQVVLAKGERVTVEYTDGTQALIKPARHGGG